jgi:hypothetical protein
MGNGDARQDMQTFFALWAFFTSKDPQKCPIFVNYVQETLRPVSNCLNIGLPKYRKILIL